MLFQPLDQLLRDFCFHPPRQPGEDSDNRVLEQASVAEARPAKPAAPSLQRRIRGRIPFHLVPRSLGHEPPVQGSVISAEKQSRESSLPRRERSAADASGCATSGGILWLLLEAHISRLAFGTPPYRTTKERAFTGPVTHGRGWLFRARRVEMQPFPRIRVVRAARIPSSS